MEKVEILIDSKKYSDWTEVEITHSLDSFDTVRFTAPFEPSRKEFRATFEPLSFKPVQVRVGGLLRFTGTMMHVSPRFDASQSSIEVTAYSRPAVLCDCTAPTGQGYQGRRPKGAIKTQFNKGLTLQAIAQQLCDPFDLDCTFTGNDPGPPFAGVSIKIEEKIHSFLVALAKQRNFVIRSTPAGGLHFQRSISGGKTTPAAEFIEGIPPLTKVTANISPQDYYSQITGYSPAKKGKPGGAYTVLNPWLGKDLAKGAPIDQFRPLSCKFDDTERADAPDATLAKIGRMFGNVASYSIEDIPTWRTPGGQLWNANLPIILLAPRAMVYRETELIIREVKLKQTYDSETASFELVLPGAFSGEIPKALPWQESTIGASTAFTRPLDDSNDSDWQEEFLGRAT